MIANFTKGISGLYLSQKGLQVTGHNLANVNTAGYTRQRVDQYETFNVTIGNNGKSILRVGTGVDILGIRQIRDEWLDVSYRNENTKYNYYAKQYSVITELENVLNGEELDGFQETMNDFLKSIANLSTLPDSLEARASFVKTAEQFITKAQYVTNQFAMSQDLLNEEVINTTYRANSIIEQIYSLNESIHRYELNGDQANDLRDQRNLLVDELSGILPIEVTAMDKSRIQIYAGLRPLFDLSGCETMTFTQAAPGSIHQIPVWKNGLTPVVNTNSPVSPDEVDGGTLKALIFARGTGVANYSTPDSVVKNYTIPKYQKQFDTLIHDIVTMINDLMAPQPKTDGPYGLDNSQYIEIFSRKGVERYDENGNYIAEDPDNPDTLYTIQNLIINPELVEDYNKVCTSLSGGVGDNTLIEQIIAEWSNERISSSDGTAVLSYSDYYAELIDNLGTEGQECYSYAENQMALINKIESDRQQIMGVSMDQELTNLIKYQHAYGASAKVIKTLDSMIETLLRAVGA